MKHVRHWCIGGCGKQWAENKMVDRGEDRGRMCYPCFNALTYANAPGTKPAPSQSQRNKSRLSNYKLTPEEFEEMVAEQGGLCAICLTSPHGGHELVIDHNHETGAVRGLLCGPCNTALGMFLDDPDLLKRAFEYLTERGNYAHKRARSAGH